MKISGAIFDMDGTLLDSMHVWKGLSVQFARSLGLEPDSGFEKRMGLMTFEEVSQHMGEAYGLSISVEELTRGMNALAKERYDAGVEPKPGLTDFLDKLQERGVKMCVATMTEAYLAEPVLEQLGLMKYFSKVFTCSMVGAGKEHPDIYEAALEHLGTPKEETPVFEDALYAITTVKKAGFPVVGVYESVFDIHRSQIERLADVFIEDYRTQTLI